MNQMMHQTAWAFVLAGAVNLGLKGLGGFLGMELDVLHSLLGFQPGVEWMIYVVIGILAVMLAMEQRFSS